MGASELWAVYQTLKGVLAQIPTTQATLRDKVLQAVNQAKGDCSTAVSNEQNA